MYLTRKALPRRTFLRGLGAAVARPMLDAMVPALSAATKAPPRLGFIYIANGVIQKNWNPSATGSGFELSPTLRELVGKVQANDPYIAGVRVGQNQPRVVRLVVDLKQPISPQQFTLEPVAAYQHRLVFDLYPVQERDPLLALIRDKDQADLRTRQTLELRIARGVREVNMGRL